MTHIDSFDHPTTGSADGSPLSGNPEPGAGVAGLP